METRQPRSTRRLREANVGKSREGSWSGRDPVVCARSVCVRVSISRRVMGLRVGYIAAACGCIIYIAADSAIHADAYLRHRVDRQRDRQRESDEASSERKWD